VGPTCHPRPRVVPDSDSAAAAESELCTTPTRGPHAEGTSPGPFKAARAPRVLHPSHPSPSRHPTVLRRRRNPSFPLPQLDPRLRCCLAIAKPSKTRIVCCQARASWRPSNLAGDRTRAASSTGRFAFSPSQPPPLVASPARAPHVGALRAPIRGRKPKIGSRRRAPPPRRLHAFLAVRSRSNAPDRIPPPALPACHRSRWI
jgi:hypothetical protein